MNERKAKRWTCKASSCEKVRGVVLEISPMKKGKTGASFFDGRISNRVPSVRFMELDSKVRHRIVEYKGKETAVTDVEV